jgi:outer membrane lipoprotein-sorting protein
MGELSEVLELMQGARARFRTVRAVVREWTHVPRSEVALGRYVERRRGSGVDPVGAMQGGPGGGRGAEQSGVTRLWWQKPDRVRLERGEPGGGRASWLEVAVGDEWWGYQPEWGAVSNQGDPEMKSGGRNAPFPELFEPALHLPALDLELAGEASQAGRAGVLLRGLPRDLDESLFTPILPRGADVHELVVDALTGVVLRRASLVDGEPFSVTEIEEVGFNEPLLPEIFVFRPPPGVPVRPAEEVFRGLPADPG